MCRQPRLLTMIVLACALFLRLVPAGWMPAPKNGAFAIELCSAAASLPRRSSTPARVTTARRAIATAATAHSPRSRRDLRPRLLRLSCLRLRPPVKFSPADLRPYLRARAACPAATRQGTAHTRLIRSSFRTHQVITCPHSKRRSSRSNRPLSWSVVAKLPKDPQYQGKRRRREASRNRQRPQH